MNNLNNYILKNKIGKPRLVPYQRPSDPRQPSPRRFQSSIEREIYVQNSRSTNINQNRTSTPFIRGDRQLAQSASSHFATPFSAVTNYDYVMKDDISAPMLSVPMDANFSNHTFDYGNHASNQMNRQNNGFSNQSTYSVPFENNHLQNIYNDYDTLPQFLGQQALVRMDSTENALDELSIQETAVNKSVKSSKPTNQIDNEKSVPKYTPRSSSKSGKFGFNEEKAEHISPDKTPNTKVVTTSVENLKKIINSCPDCNFVFEIFAYCINIRPGDLPNEKIILIRDQIGPVMQVTYFEVDTPLKGITPGSFIRVVGTMKSHNRLGAITVRAADLVEEKIASRLFAVYLFSKKK